MRRIARVAFRLEAPDPTRPKWAGRFFGAGSSKVSTVVPATLFALLLPATENRLGEMLQIYRKRLYPQGPFLGGNWRVMENAGLCAP